MENKFIKSWYRLLFVIAVFSSLIINLLILFDCSDPFDKRVDRVIDWSWIIGTNPWWHAIANIIFSLSNLLFWFVGANIIGRHLFEHWGKRKNQMGWWD